ncbi:uncharacterized protein [Drosophila tropicalis]|uniref:uncharacterized protein n=1 Tax=Drosophila tropicalis TaxID=46794 RepID=UPI0035AB6D6C
MILGDCTISRNMVEGTNRIFTHRDAKGNYQLQRLEIVPTGVTLHMFCSSSDVIETKCQDDGRFSEPLPMSCSNPMPTSLTRIKDNECPATMYSVGYVIQGQQLELYRTCFDTNTLSVLYSTSDVYYKTFFPRRPWVEFLTDEMLTPAEAASYMKQRIYNNFCYIFGQAQTYLPGPGALIINRGHMVASADFLFIDQMGSTFRYLNIVPQIKSINDGNWRLIEEWVRRMVPENSPFRVKTGGIGTLMLTDERGISRAACLYNANKIPVPEWTYKVVKDANGNGLYVFLTYNSSFDRERPAVLSICSAVQCPLYLPDNAVNGYTFCCDPSKFPY